MNILFVCSRNKWRSRTAETIFKNNGKHQVRSAGTEPSARIKLSYNLLNWADEIYVMERKHQKRILANFDIDGIKDKIDILDIPDDYKYMDKELITILRTELEDIF